jgi:hypothetical protein
VNLLSWHLPVGTEKNHETPSKITGYLGRNYKPGPLEYEAHGHDVLCTNIMLTYSLEVNLYRFVVNFTILWKLKSPNFERAASVSLNHYTLHHYKDQLVNAV